MTTSTSTTPQMTGTETPVLDALSEAWLLARAEGEPDWLRDRRLEALKRYLDQRWPDSRQDEYWRSTPFDRRFDVEVPVIADGSDAAAPTALVDEVDDATAVLRIVDGVVTDVTVPAALADQGVIVASLADAAEDHAELVREHLGSMTTSNPEGSGANEDRTVTANDAAWTAGAFIHVPQGVEVAAPIGVQVHVTRPGAHLPRVLAVLAPNARARIYLEHTSALPGQAAALVDQVVEAVVQDGGSLDLVSLNEWEDTVAHLGLQKVAAHRNATVRHVSVTVGGATVRLRPECDLLGPGASVFPLGIYFADEGQWFDLQPYIRHLAPRATSDVLFKGALQGKSRTVFRGNVFVAKNAVGTDTNETNRSLILTDGARADSTPFLEIECADITAGHGSATGQIDSRHLFYLESRGISREQALRLIVHGFFREVLSAVNLPGLEARALAHIEHEIALADLDHIGVSDPAPLGETVEGDA